MVMGVVPKLAVVFCLLPYPFGGDFLYVFALQFSLDFGEHDPCSGWLTNAGLKAPEFSSCQNRREIGSRETISIPFIRG